METKIRKIKFTQVIKALTLITLMPSAVLAIDSDNDGWSDEIDSYPLHRIVSQPVTNVLSQNSFDPESNTYQWQAFNYASVNGITEIKETIGHDGGTTLALHLQPTINESSNKFGFDGPTLAMVEGKEVSHVRLSAWIKIEGPEGVNPSFPSLGISYTSEPYFHPSTGRLVSSSGRSRLFRSDSYYNQGWVYNQWDFELNAPAKTIAVKVQIEQQLGYDFWLDEIELNFINRQDSDGDGLIDAIDPDDDNDEILDGLDDTPLAELSVDNDEDGIVDGYDDDLDNDGIVNALEYMPYVELTSNHVNGVVTLTAQKMEWPIDTDVDYIWSLDGLELAENSNIISINYSDYAPSTTIKVTVTVTATDGQLISAVSSYDVVTPDNIKPTLSLEISGTETMSQFKAVASDVDGHQLQYFWSINNIDQIESGNILSIDHNDFDAGSTLNIKVIVSDGYESVSESHSIIMPEKESSSGGGALYILMLLATVFVCKRSNH